MHTRLFDDDPIAGTRQLFHWDDETQSFTIETQQDVGAIVEGGKAQYRTMDERTPWKGDMHHVARIPMTVYAELVQRGITRDPAAMKRWLNDRDNQVFRTRPGRV